MNAIRACLDAAGCSAADIDAVGYSWAESFVDQSIGNLLRVPAGAGGARAWIPISWLCTAARAVPVTLASVRLNVLQLNYG